MSTGGRPSIYSLELADKICERLAAGESMRSISRDESMPAMSTLFKWIRENEAFSQQYAKAKEESADAWVEDMLDIADNQVGNPVLVDDKPLLNQDGKAVMFVDGPAVNHARLRVDTRKWAASKLKPKKYGEKVTQEHVGKDGEELNLSPLEQGRAILFALGMLGSNQGTSNSNSKEGEDHA